MYILPCLSLCLKPLHGFLDEIPGISLPWNEIQTLWDKALPFFSALSLTTVSFPPDLLAAAVLT